MSHLPNRAFGFQTRAIHSGYDPLEDRGAVAPPIYMTSTFAFPDVEAANAVIANEAPGFLYGREHNPTQDLLERRIADLEGAEAAVVTASGMAAIASLFLSLMNPGDEIIVHETLYSNTTALTEEGLPRFGVKLVKIDLSQPEALRRAITPKSRFVYFETPINPTGDVLDIWALSEVAHAAGLTVVVDSTFASPALQRPLEHGADLVVHSLTKYINGHGDLWEASWSAMSPRSTPSETAASATSLAQHSLRWPASWFCAVSKPCRCACASMARTRWRWPRCWQPIRPCALFAIRSYRPIRATRSRAVR
jgi:methionine-gamma-lyase